MGLLEPVGSVAVVSVAALWVVMRLIKWSLADGGDRAGSAVSTVVRVWQLAVLVILVLAVGPAVGGAVVGGVEWVISIL